MSTSPLFTPTLPDVITFLAALWQGWPGLEGVQVLDGPTAQNSQAEEVLAVGWAGPQAGSEADAVGEFIAEGLGGHRARERYVVHNSLAVVNGQSDFAASRARATQLWTEAYRAVYADTTLGGLVGKCIAQDWNVTQDLTNRGALVTVVFDLDINSYTRP